MESLSTRRDFLRRAGAAVVLSGGALAALESCGAGASTGSATGGTPPGRPTGTLRIQNSEEPNFIDPAKVSEIYEYGVVRNVYDTLAQWNTDYTKLQPALATSWQSDDTATAWTFKLRGGVTFHDGAAFDSSAVAATFRHYAEQASSFFTNLTAIDTPDPRTVTVHLSKPTPDFARNQASIFQASPKLLESGQAGQRAVGTGPFKWKSWSHGQSITLEANPDYWAGAPHLEQLQYQTITDYSVAVNALRSGSLDLVQEIPARQRQSFVNKSGFQVFSKPVWLSLQLVCLCDRAPFNDVRVRQALAYAIDRKAIIDHVLLGQGVLAKSIMPTGVYGYSAPRTAYSPDPRKARALLKAAGHGQGLTFSWAAPSSTVYPLVAQAIVQQAKQAGFTINLDLMEGGVFVQDLLSPNPRHQVFMTTYGWLNGGPFHFDDGSVLKHCRYTGAQLTSLIQQTTTTADGPERLKALADAQELYMREVPGIPLYNAINSDVGVAALRGYTNPKDAYMPVFSRAFLAK